MVRWRDLGCVVVVVVVEGEIGVEKFLVNWDGLKAGDSENIRVARAEDIENDDAGLLVRIFIIVIVVYCRPVLAGEF